MRKGKGKIFSRYDFERLFDIIQNRGAVSTQEVQNADVLKKDFKHSHLVDPHEIRPNVVTMNTKFRLKNLGNGKKYVYSLVFPNDCADENEKINVLSGLGAQILGSTIGTVIKNNPSGDQYFVIEEILYQPEAAGDYNL